MNGTMIILFFIPTKYSKEKVSQPRGNYSSTKLLQYLKGNNRYKIFIFSKGSVEEKYDNLEFLQCNIKNIFTTLEKIKHNKKKVVLSQLHEYFPYAFFTKLISNGKLILRTGGIFYGRQKINSLFFCLKRIRLWLYYQLSDVVISTADCTPVDLYMRRMGVPKNKYRKWVNGFPIIENKNKYKRRNQILCISRLSPEKNVDYVIHSFAKAIPVLNEEYRLVVVGDGPQKDELIELVKDLKIVNNVNFVGYSNNLSKYYYTSKLLITGLSNNPIIEGIVTNTPLITVDLGETAKLYSHFQNIFIVDYPPGGYGKIKEEYFEELVNKTAEYTINILNHYHERKCINKVDYEKYGWEQRLTKELKAYDGLYRIAE